MSKKRGNYLIVCHTYFVGHKRWYERILIDVTEKEANGEAALLETSHKGTCLNSDAKAFLLPDTILVQRERS